MNLTGQFLWLLHWVEIHEAIDDYGKDGGVRLLCSFYHDALHAHIIRNVESFAF